MGSHRREKSLYTELGKVLWNDWELRYEQIGF